MILDFVLSLDMESIEKIPEQFVNVLLCGFCLASLILEGPRFTALGIFLRNASSSLFSAALGYVFRCGQTSALPSEPTPGPTPPLTTTLTETQTKTVMVEEVEEMAVKEQEVEDVNVTTVTVTPAAPPATATSTEAVKAKAAVSIVTIAAVEPERVEKKVETNFIEKAPELPKQKPKEVRAANEKKSLVSRMVTSVESTRTAAISQAAPSSSKTKGTSNVNVNAAVNAIVNATANTNTIVNANSNANAKANVSGKNVPPSLRATVHKVFPYPSLSGYERAIRYLESCCSPTVGYQSRISNHRDLSESVEIKTEIFTSALLFDLIASLPGISSEIPEILLSFVSKHTGVGVFNKFVDRSVADDVDTTSVCLWSLLSAKPASRIELNSAKAIAKILTLNNNEGGGGRVIQALIPPFPKGTSRVEIDVAALANVMRVLYFLGMESGAKETEDYVFRWLHNSDNFTRGTAFYHSADSVLYFLSNSFSISKKMKTRFCKVMMVRLLSNLGKTEYPLDLALRIMTAYNLGLYSDDENFSQEQSKFQDKAKFDILKMEIMKLRNLQLDDGSWPLDAVYRFDSFFFGSKAAITAFATKALYLSRNISNF